LWAALSTSLGQIQRGSTLHWREGDLEERRVVGQPIALVRREEEEMHYMVEDSFESIREYWVHAWLRAKNKGIKALASPQFPVSRFDDAIREIWMTPVARSKTTWKARAVASMSGCTSPFTDEGVALDGADTSSILICPKCIYFPKHFCCCFSSNLCVLNRTNTD
jgi:hypothetical protein